MKSTYIKRPFAPFTITIENEEDLAQLNNLVHQASMGMAMTSRWNITMGNDRGYNFWQKFKSLIDCPS